MRLFRKERLYVSQLPELLQRTSTLLKEGYTFAECIDMLLPYHVKDYERWVPIFREAFQQGIGTAAVFERLGVRKQYLMPIELAESSGNLSETLHIVAQQLAFAHSFRTQLRKLLIYPSCLFVGIICLFIAFRVKFLPSIQQMMHVRTEEELSGVRWSAFFMHTPDYIILFGCLVVLSVVGFLFYSRKKHIAVQIAMLFKLPFIGTYWRLVLTRQFSRILGELLLTGFSLQDALRVIIEQRHQRQLAYVAEVVEQRVVYGDALAEAVVVSGLFYPKFEHFIAHGEQSGLLGRELILYAELLEEKLQQTVKAATTIVQPVLFVVIAICIIAAYLSILLPLYSMLDIV